MVEEIKERMEREAKAFSQTIKNLKEDLNKWLVEESIRSGPKKFANSNFTVISKPGTFTIEMRDG